MNRNMNRNQNQQNMSENKKRFNNLRQKHRLKIIRSNNDNQNVGRPVKILTAHKLQSSREEMVKKNLQHLKEATAAKRTAQNHYYGQGKSPLLKNETQLKKRTSIQERIGKIRTQQQPIIQQQNTQQRKLNLRQQKLQRVNNFNNKKVFVKNNNNAQIKVMRTIDGKVKILRKLNSTNKVKKQPKPNNYVINLRNETKSLCSKFKITTDPKIQQEIKLLQNKTTTITNSVPNVINRSLTIADYRVPIATTTISINERFNHYKFVH